MNHIKAGINGGTAPRHKWTEDERDIVRREYDGTNQTARLIAAKIAYSAGERVTFNAVKGQVQKLGLAIDKSRRWTPEEIEILQEMITKYAPITIARRLHRSENSVIVKSKRLGCSRRARDDWFTKKEVCEILGVDHRKIQGYIDRGELKASWHTSRKPQKNGMALWQIETTDLRDFIEKNAGDFLGRNVDLTVIVWLLTGAL